jgi:hypothetical protein
MKSRHRIPALLAAVSLATVVAGCGGGASDDSASRSTAGGAAAEKDVPAPAPADGLRDGAAAKPEGVAKPGAKPAAALERAVIATGSMQLASGDLEAARGQAIGLATGAGGHVDDEQSQSDEHGRLVRVDLTLRVPAASFERTLDALGRLGVVKHRQQSVEDVTTQVIDNSARIKAQSASVESVEQLLARANTIGEVISIENELARRQADLDSLKQQERWLADQTGMSTVQVSIVRTHKAAAKHPAPTHAGFMAGLEGGWHALARTTVALSTVVGALLPFAVVLALVGAPAWFVARRRRGVPAPPPAEV